MIANLIDINSNTTQLQVTTGSATQSGNISESNGPRPLEKTGAGTLNLTGINTFTGALTISGGGLGLSNGNAVADTAPVVVDGGTVLTVNNTETIGSLSGAGNVNIAAGQTLTTGGNGSSTTFSGAIAELAATAALTKTGGGRLNLTGDSSYTGPTTVDGGTLAVNGSIVSDVTVNGGRLGGSGRVGAVTVTGGTFAPGNSIGTMTVMGDFLLAPGTVYEVEAGPGANNSDKVIVVGTVNITGATLRVLAQNGNYAASTNYLIIDNDGTDPVAGPFGNVTTNLAFLSPSVSYTGDSGNDVVLTLTRNQTSMPGVADTPDQGSVARALSRFPTDNPLFLAVLNQTAAGARQAFDALSGEIHATLPGILADDSRYVREAVLGRLMQANATSGSHTQVASLGAAGPQVASLDANAMALGSKFLGEDMPAPGPDLAFWTRAYGAWGDFDGDGNAATADRDLGGFVSGMDANIGGSWRAGLATGASFSSVDVDARTSSADVESYHRAGPGNLHRTISGVSA